MEPRDTPMIRGKIFLYLQFLFIVLLIFALSTEYQANQYQQTWVSANAPWLQFLLNGYMAAALVGILIGGAVLLIADIWKNRNRGPRLKSEV